MAKQTIANLLRIPIHYYALANWQGFIEIINLIGGVDLYVDKDMHYEDPWAKLKIDIKHGYQHLDGEKSGQYVRFRSDELGDIGRVQRQQKFLKALGLQMYSIENITKIPKLLSTAKQYIETDMDTVTMLKAARSFNIMSDNNIRSGMLYGNFYDSPSSGISYWRANRADIEKSLNEVDIPYMTMKEGPGDGDPVEGVDALGYLCKKIAVALEKGGDLHICGIDEARFKAEAPSEVKHLQNALAKNTTVHILNNQSLSEGLVFENLKKKVVADNIPLPPVFVYRNRTAFVLFQNPIHVTIIYNEPLAEIYRAQIEYIWNKEKSL